MISLLFWCLAAICNSIMDVCFHHFDSSVFNSKKFNTNFWDTEFSWKNKYVNWPYNQSRKSVKIWKWKFNYPVQLTDSFHLFKMLMIVFICLSIVTFEPYFNFQLLPDWLQFVLHIASYGLWWNATFNLFYNHILIKKT